MNYPITYCYCALFFLFLSFNCCLAKPLSPNACEPTSLNKDSTWATYPQAFTPVQAPCPSPSWDSISTTFVGRGISVVYNGKQHQNVLWDFPNGDQYCNYRLIKNKKNLYFYPSPGETILIRLKGTCTSNIESDFSDTLRLQIPCKLDSSGFHVRKITDQTVSVELVNDVCTSFLFMVSRDSLLPDSLWKTILYSGFPGQEFKNLTPNTQYFAKVRIKCFGGGTTFAYTPVKSFRTLPLLAQCESIDPRKTKISSTNSDWLIRTTTPAVSSKLEVRIEDMDGFEESYSEYFSEYIFLRQMSFDTRYRIKIKNHCGAIESDWKDFIFDTMRTSSCPVLSSQRIRLTEKVDTLRLTYIKNPTLPISGPYLWRYKRSGYAEWLDSLITDSVFVDFPLNLPVERTYSVEVKSLFYPGCVNSTTWSVPFKFWKKCIRPENRAFIAKAISNQSIEVSIDRNQLYPDAEVWYKKQGEAFSQKIKLDQHDTSVKLMDLSPNTIYDVRVCNVCTPLGTSFSYNCSEIGRAHV